VRADPRDLILPLLVVAVVGMMVFPLPRAILDVLLVANISFALTLLVCSVYVAEPVRFTALPATLLLATVMRLGLNISTTRQLLAHGEAPQLVTAFGSFVVSGNLVVGVVVFAIVTIIQFLVIAKGAERIAEVSARFTLDAMPGKQMSIDADIRAGILSLQEAKEKRSELQRESKLYGALDGAMKFVKGDAIAGLLVTLVNISAGLIVGVTQHNLSFSEAAAKFTLFTIGDGLVSQIPALFVSVAAAIVVTRVQGSEESFLGRDLVRQISHQPQTLATTGAVLLILSCLPGFPTLAFVGLASILLIGALYRKAALRREDADRAHSVYQPQLSSNVLLTLTPPLARSLQEQGGAGKCITSVKRSLFEKWGVLLNDVGLELDHSQGEVAALGLKLQSTTLLKQQIDLNQSGDLVERIAELLVQSLEEELATLIDDTQTRLLLEVHQGAAEELINSVIPATISATGLTVILRELVREQLAIKDLRTILQAIAEFSLREEKGAVYSALPRNPERTIIRQFVETQDTDRKGEFNELLAEVRESLARTITSQFAADGVLSAYTLRSDVDSLLVRSTVSQTPLKPEIVSRIRAEVEATLGQDNEAVVLSSKLARGLCRQVLSAFPSVTALSVTEILPEIDIQVLGEIGAKEPSANAEVRYLDSRAA